MTGSGWSTIISNATSNVPTVVGSNCFDGCCRLTSYETIPSGWMTPSSPDAPTSLIATTISSSEIDLAWIAPINDGGRIITGYKIERADSGYGIFSTLVANTGNTNVIYSDITCVEGTQYAYRVLAINSINIGLVSDIVNTISASESATKLLSSFDGVDGAQAYTDILAGAYTFENYGRLDASQFKFGTASLQLATEQITNGGFETWSSGNTNPPDGWTRFGFSNTIAKETAIVKSGLSSIKMVFSGNGGVRQSLLSTKAIAWWKGQTVTIGCWINTSDIRYARIFIEDGTGDSSAYATTPNVWQYVTVTRTVSSSATLLNFACYLETSSVTAYFDGASVLQNTDNRVYLPDSDNWYFGTGNFTVDFQVRFSDLNGQQCLISQLQNGSNYWMIYKVATSHKLYIQFQYGGAWKGCYVMSNNWNPAINTWYHIAVVRNGTVGKLFIDGVSQTLSTVATFGTNDVGNIASSLQLGFVSGTGHLDGWLDELRISKGIARWTSNFTPPVSAYTINTKLLLHTDALPIVDSTGLHTVTNHNVIIDTTNKEFGIGSAQFTDSSSYLEIPNSNDFNFGTEDFTIDMWTMINGSHDDDNQVLYDNDLMNGIYIRKGAGNGLEIYSGSGSSVINASWSPILGEWYHIAITRASGTLRAFIDGIKVGEVSLTRNITTTQALYLGGISYGYLIGNLDEVRISKGIAHWIGDFTPPDRTY